MELTKQELSTIIGDIRRETDGWIVERQRLNGVLEKYGKVVDGVHDDLAHVSSQVQKRQKIIKKLNKELEKACK